MTTPEPGNAPFEGPGAGREVAAEPGDLTGLTLEQLAGLGSGADVYSTKTVGAVPPVLLTDGPHGLRKEAGEGDGPAFSAALPATCFPPAVALAQTWDPVLVRRVGAALGVECQAADVQVLLGPGVNLKRDPRGGRNFEYFSEDPHLTGELGAAWVHGVQGEGVGASLKHFAVNDQEHDRMRISADVDPRPLREVHLRAFQRIVEDARPWTVMAAYNRVNGVHATEHRWLLTDVLRGEWGFDGAVVSDWAAVVDRVAAIAAGTDLQMPWEGGAADRQVVEAVEGGRLPRAAVERAAGRVARLARRARAARRPGTTWSVDDHHRLARAAATRAIVLLRDDHRLLPLERSGVIAVIGGFATHPRFQGGGSSHVHATRVDVPLDELRELAGDARVVAAPGWSDDPAAAADLRAAAATTAAEADVAVLFLGLDERAETEGVDRTGIDLPADQLALLEAVTAVQPRTVVVLAHGGVLQLGPILAGPAAIVDGALLGQAGGGALADVLFGVVGPSGRLAETVPLRIEDVPAFTSFPGELGRVRYGEGLFVGYRWYDARALPVAFPFGHGLSYTVFRHESLRIEADPVTDGVVVEVVVRNAGDRAGREVVQLYAERPGSAVSRAPRWLVGFAGIELQPGESGAVRIPVAAREFEHWDDLLQEWVVEPGTVTIAAGASSRDLRQRGDVELRGRAVRYPLTRESSMAAVLRDAVAGPALRHRLAPMVETLSADWGAEELARMLESLPFARVLEGYGLGIPPEVLDRVLAEANAAAVDAR